MPDAQQISQPRWGTERGEQSPSGRRGNFLRPHRAVGQLPACGTRAVTVWGAAPPVFGGWGCGGAGQESPGCAETTGRLLVEQKSRTTSQSVLEEDSYGMYFSPECGAGTSSPGPVPSRSAGLGGR